MSPSDPKTRLETDPTRALLGAMQALRVVMAKLEQKAATVIWNGDPNYHHYNTKCVMEAAKAFSEALDKCRVDPPRPTRGDPGTEPGSGPDCGPGYHEEFGNCVPNN